MLKKYFLPLLLVSFFSCTTDSTPAPDSQTEQEKSTPEPTTTNTTSSEKTTPAPEKACWEINPSDRLESNFNTALEGLKGLDYQYDLKKLESRPVEQAYVLQRIPVVNKFPKRVKNNDLVEAIPHTGIAKVNYAFIKGQKAMSGNLYPRAEIEEWIFKSETCATEVAEILDRIQNNGHQWEHISKSPISTWQQENRIYFLTPGGFYMLSEVKVIQEKLYEAL